MNFSTKKYCAQRVISLEAGAFCTMIIIIWLNELFDLPYHLLGAEATPVNWRESILESSMLAVLGYFVIRNTRELFNRMRHLEGILPICSSCKRIRDEKNSWQPVDKFVHEHSEVDFSHGLCEECVKHLYPDLVIEGRDKPEKNNDA